MNAETPFWGKFYKINLVNTKNIKEFLTRESSSTLKMKGKTVQAKSLSSKFPTSGS